MVARKCAPNDGSLCRPLVRKTVGGHSERGEGGTGRGGKPGGAGRKNKAKGVGGRMTRMLHIFVSRYADLYISKKFDGLHYRELSICAAVSRLLGFESRVPTDS